jgi:predicted acylesterase/phospholipase RssA
MTEAVVPNIPNARYWRDELPADMPAIINEILSQRRAAGSDGDVAYLALSGGADDGAFGAGLMAAWSVRGDRPEFQTVTGVSTGALSAPFVFLGAN